ncbi:hypothetical protein [Pseudomarimonas salicorniae]|uniref:Uncharacterized protein n=1 Tax=Pseudomarimonas salicorniae TaxID=2933270 RepID=A0ABT0GGV6_9GAMM|nr:hypothetical protein [Lysobacter sp. CAU 1642]MCK7593767.1 hypothetical protein [Lysobacter sp. CAU 1642]
MLLPLRPALLATLLWPAVTAAHDPASGDPPFFVAGRADTITVDGLFDPFEWADAGSFVAPINLPAAEGGGTRKATLYFANDQENLYLAIRVALAAESRLRLGLRFDNDHDGARDSLEDRASAEGGGTAPQATYVDAVMSGLGEVADTLAGGSSDGLAAWGHDGAFLFIEMSKPLNSGDGNDFAVGPGQTLGIGLHLRVESGGAFAETLVGMAAGPTPEAGYADLRITPFLPGEANTALSQLIGPEGDGFNPLAGIQPVAVSRAGNVYVAGCESNNVFRINPDGDIREVFDGTAGPAAPCACPTGLSVRNPGVQAVGADEIVTLACRGSDKVVALIVGESGSPEIVVLSSGSMPAAGVTLTSPRETLVDRDVVYVTGGESSNVVVIGEQSGASVIRELVGPGGVAGGQPLTAPAGLVLGSGGRVLFVDATAQTPALYEFDPRDESTPADDVVVRLLGPEGDGTTPVRGTLSGPAFGPGGVRYVYDSAGSLFQVSADGVISVLSRLGAQPNPPRTQRIAVDSRWQIYLGGARGVITRLNSDGFPQPIATSDEFASLYPTVNARGDVFLEAQGADQLLKLPAPPASSLLIPSNIAEGDRFGAVMTSCGDRVMAVGLPNADGGRGRVMHYELRDGTLLHTGAIRPPQGVPAYEFGAALDCSLSEDGERYRLLVGAPGDPFAGKSIFPDQFRAGIYERDVTWSTWALVSDFEFPDDTTDSGLGFAVALEGEHCVIVDRDGEAHLCEPRLGGSTTWQTARRRSFVRGIRPINSDALDIGIASDGSVFIGEMRAAEESKVLGSLSFRLLNAATGQVVHEFADPSAPAGAAGRSGTVRFQPRTRARPSEISPIVQFEYESGQASSWVIPPAVFGYSVANKAGAGSAPIRLDPGVDVPGSRFGASLAFTQNGLLVGAPGLDGGAGRVFRFDADYRLVDEVRAPGDSRGFGANLAVLGDTVLVGAPESTQGTGSMAVIAPRVDIFESSFERVDASQP